VVDKSKSKIGKAQRRVSKWLGPSGITRIDVSFTALLQSGDEAVV